MAEVVELLVGLQAQAAMPPYFGLWSRRASTRTCAGPCTSCAEGEEVLAEAERMATFTGATHVHFEDRRPG